MFTSILNIYSIDITLLFRIIDEFFGTIGSVDTLVYGNLAQLVFHHGFSFWLKLSYGSSACISCIVLIKDWCSLYSSSQSTIDFFLIGSLSLKTCFLVILFLVIAMLTSIIWIEGLTTLGSTTNGFSTIFTPLFLNIF